MMEGEKSSEVTMEVRYLLSQFKERFSNGIITEMLSDYAHTFGRQKKDRWRYSKSVMTFILALHGYSQRHIARYQGVSHQAVHIQFWRGKKIIEEHTGINISRKEIRMQLKVINKFDAAHFLPNYKGKCSLMHGHTWKMITTFEGHVNPDSGMICDFVVLKKIVKNSVPDHGLVNEYVEIPTAENMCLYLSDRIKSEMEVMGLEIRLTEIELYETENNCAILQVTY